jgi:hypothetical protein
MLYVAAVELATYADASVVCGPLETVTIHGTAIRVDKIYD